MIDGWITQLRKGVVEYGVLLVLSRGESYGYEIVQALKAEPELAAGESTIYPILARLRDDGCLSCREVKGEGGPPRRYFTLTDKGRIRLSEMDAYWPALSRGLQHLRNRRNGEDGGDNGGGATDGHPRHPGPTPPPPPPPPPPTYAPRPRLQPGADIMFWA